MFYLANEVNFIKYLNYFYKLNLSLPPKHKLESYKGGNETALLQSPCLPFG